MPLALDRRLVAIWFSIWTTWFAIHLTQTDHLNQWTVHLFIDIQQKTSWFVHNGTLQDQVVNNRRTWGKDADL